MHSHADATAECFAYAHANAAEFCFARASGCSSRIDASTYNKGEWIRFLSLFMASYIRTRLVTTGIIARSGSEITRVRAQVRAYICLTGRSTFGISECPAKDGNKLSSLISTNQISRPYQIRSLSTDLAFSRPFSLFFRSYRTLPHAHAF